MFFSQTSKATIESAAERVSDCWTRAGALRQYTLSQCYMINLSIKRCGHARRFGAEERQARRDRRPSTPVNRKHGIDVSALVLAGIGAPLGWFVLHTAMAFHYADIYFFDDPECADDDKDLDFPGRGDPGAWDFLYYSFVVGMTAQVSDVQVRTSVMRRATLFHSVVSFFFNTVFIAMAVNAGVTLAS